MALLVFGVKANTHSTTIDPKQELAISTVEELLTKEINNDNPYLDEQPVLQRGQHVYPVLFEPIKHIKLSRSTYKVTSFIDFTPHLRTFESFENYLEQLIKDLNDEEKVGGLKYIQEMSAQKAKAIGHEGDHLVKVMVAPELNCSTSIEQFCLTHANTSYTDCYEGYTTICDIKRKFKKALAIVNHIKKDFLRTKEHFYRAIDHVQDNQEEVLESREKRDTETQQDILRAIRMFSKEPTREEKEFIDNLMNKIAKYSPDIHENIEKHLNRQKRFGLMTWVMGWGVWSNAMNIKKIKKNVRMLQKQNILQEKQIMELAHYLNLTATHVQMQDKLIEEIQTQLVQINFNLISLHIRLDFHIHVSSLIQDITSATHRLLIGLIAIRNNVEKIYEYMRVIATHKVHPALIPPQPLRDLLVHVRDKMRENPRLELPYSPDNEIWEYYEIMKITPIIVNDLMVILLTIPITDKSLAMNVYKST